MKKMSLKFLTLGVVAITLVGCGLEEGSVAARQQAESGQLVAAPAALGFGAVCLGSQQTLKTLISNQGSAPVSIDGIFIYDSPFTIVGPSLKGYVLPPGGWIGAEVSFKPSGLSKYIGTLDVLSKDAPLSVQLAGFGIDDPSSCTR